MCSVLFFLPGVSALHNRYHKLPPSPPPSLPTTTFDFNGGVTGLGWSTGGGDPTTSPYAFTVKWNGTPSPSTGPSAGVRGSGSYVYAETSGGSTGDLFTLAYDGSACSDIGEGVSTVAFQYHMYGATMGELRVTNAAGEAVWSLSGDQGNSWQAATVEHVYSPSFGFEYRRGRSYTGDAAVALVAVSCGAALPPPPLSPPPPPPSPAPPLVEGCVMWRQTGRCDTNGPREPRNDKGCCTVIPRSHSGW